MSSGITLSSATRSNLLSLQDTASLVATTQNRLSTGKKVNSAIDDATNYFTASGLSSRSSALSTLLDGISNGIQTIQAASQGITSIQKLTAQLKSTAQQALASSNSFTSKAQLSTTSAVSLDANGKLLGGASTAATTTGTAAFVGGTLTGFTQQANASSTSAVNLGATTVVPTKQSALYSGASIVAQTAATVSGAVTADDTALQGKTGTISLDDGNGHTATYTVTGSSTKTALTSALTASGFTASFDASNNLQISRADGTNFTATSSSTAITTASSSNGVTTAAADALTLTVGGHTTTFHAVATGANASAGTFSDLGGLVAAINADANFGNASATGVANKIHASNVSGTLQIDGGDEGTSFDFSGTASTKLFSAATGTAGTTLQGLAGQTLSINDGNGHLVSYAVTKTSKQSDLTTALGSQGYTATIDATTHLLKVSRTDGQNFTANGPLLSNAATSNGVSAAAADKFSLTVGGTTVSFGSVATGADTSAGGAQTFTTLNDLVTGINNSSIGAASATAGKVTASIVNDKLVLTSGDTTTSFTAGGTGATKLGVAATTTKPAQTALTGSLNVSVGDGAAKLITFGAGGVQTLDDLNAALDSAGAQATIGTDGKLNITTSNENGAETLTASGSIAQGIFGAVSSIASLQGTGLSISGDGKTARDKLITNYNDLRDQIDQLSGDAGFNGVNLLAGDTVKVIFNEKNSSSVSVKGVATDSSTLGLKSLQSVDFSDAKQINKVLDQITSANDTLGSLAATFGTNLSVVQNRQDFSKGLINILDTGAANLTDADLNEEAANSQALTTRQSLGISALSLANQAQQGILQLLR